MELTHVAIAQIGTRLDYLKRAEPVAPRPIGSTDEPEPLHLTRIEGRLARIFHTRIHSWLQILRNPQYLLPFPALGAVPQRATVCLGCAPSWTGSGWGYFFSDQV